MMINQYGDKARVVNYSTTLAELTGSVVSAAMLQFIIQNWERGISPVSWFAKPSVHRKYAKGRSWKENLGLSVEDVKYGLGFIGTRINQSTSREEVLSDKIARFELDGRLTNARHLVLWYTKAGEAFYELNAPLADMAIQLQLNGDWVNYLSPITQEMREVEKPREKEEKREDFDPASISAFSNFIIPEGLEVKDGES